MVGQSIATPNVWPGASWASVLVLSVFSLFMAGLLGAAVATHARHHAIGLASVGTVMLAVLALYQAKILLGQARRR
jgi:hypothetical protein